MTGLMNRRSAVWAGLGLGLAVVKHAAARPSPAAWAVEVWKSPECGCCKAWLTHLQAQGMSIGTIHNSGNTDARKSLGIPLALGSCHTAYIEGYAIEGHVQPRKSSACSESAPWRLAWPCPACRWAAPA